MAQHIVEFHREALDGAGGALVGADGEGLVAFHFQQVGDVLEDFGDLGVVHGLVSWARGVGFLGRWISG